MRVLMVASEVSPHAKTGGLADVAGALPRALARLGHQVDVVTPLYRGTARPQASGTSFDVVVGEKIYPTHAYDAVHGLVRVVLLEQPALFDRAGLYGESGEDYPDNPLRFAFLARAALDWGAAQGTAYDVVHAHDWQGGLVPVLMRQAFASHEAFVRATTVFTIHNLAYQGSFDASWLPRLGLGWGLFRPDALEYWGKVSYLKGGVMFSRRITTVSRRYAREIQTPEHGFGFDGILRSRAADLSGIVNGIDYEEWNPEVDPYLVEPFSAEHLEGKQTTKVQLLRDLGLHSDAALASPLIGMVSRMVDQKGLDLLAEIADDLPLLDATFAVLGTGDAKYESMWRSLSERHPGRIAVRVGFDEGLAHRIEGGADLFLMPSRFEPCGLNQMYSLRYGTLPIVRAVGGLADTVENLDPATGAGTGFVFEDYSPQALLGTLRWALETYQDRDQWRKMQRAGMAVDFSWDRSAREYVKVYGGATG
jgi:starch synthase